MDIDMFQRLFVLYEGEMHSRIFKELLRTKSSSAPSSIAWPI